MRYPTRDVYEGEWHRGHVCGKGRFENAEDASVYEGAFGLELRDAHGQPPALLNTSSHGAAPALTFSHTPHPCAPTLLTSTSPTRAAPPLPFAPPSTVRHRL